MSNLKGVAGIGAAAAMAVAVAGGESILKSGAKIAVRTSEVGVLAGGLRAGERDLFKNAYKPHPDFGFSATRGEFETYEANAGFQRQMEQARLTMSGERLALATSHLGSDQASNTLSSYYEIARVKTIDDLSSLTPPVSQRDIEIVINRNVKEVIQGAADAPNSSVKFEALSGKLTIEGSKTVAGIQISLGEVNVYKVSSVVAGSVATCYGMVTEKIKPCVRKALGKTSEAIADVNILEALSVDEIASPDPKESNNSLPKASSE